MNVESSKQGPAQDRRSRWPAVFLSFIVFAAFLDSALAASDMSMLLQKADDMKLPQHAQFDSLMVEIAGREADMTPDEHYRFLFLQGWNHAYDGEYAGAVSHLEAMLTQGGDATTTFRARGTLINVLVLAKQHERAFIELRKLTDQAPMITDPNALRQGRSIAAMLLNDVGDYESGLVYAEQLIAEKHGLAACSGMQLKLSALFRSGKLTVDSKDIENGIAICMEAGESLHANSIRMYLGHLLANSGHHDQALALLTKHYEELVRAKYPRLISDYDVLLARIYQLKGNLRLAKDYAQHALDFGVKDENTRPLIEAYRLLYEVAKAQGELSAALVYYEKYTAADRGLLNDATIRDVAYQRVRHEADMATLKLESLNKENQVLQLDRTLGDKAVENIRLYTLLGFIITAFIGLWAYRTKRSQLHFMMLSRRDGLTGVLSRPHFMEVARQTLQSCQATGREVCVAVCDFDNFKQINDTFGHAAGDTVLQQGAACLQGHLRDEEIVGRLGGEEFAVLLINCNIIIARERCEGLREGLMNVAIPGELSVRPSGSFGISTTATSGYGLRELLNDADAALYEAKRSGRNRVVEFQPEARQSSYDLAGDIRV